MTIKPKTNRAIAAFLLLNFSFIQILPSGLAVEQVFTPQQETQTPTTTLEESVQKEETTDSENPPPSDYEQFLDPSPISSTDVPEVKVEDVKVETVPVDGVKKYAFDTVDQISQRDHFTIQDVEALRGAQLALKKSIEDLPEDERKPWIDAFNEFLKKSDQILSSKPLKVVLEDGTELLVRNPTDIMMKIIQRFKMMDQNGEIKLERLAGIDPEDLEGLETLSDYMSNRQIGTGFSIPLFDLFSPSAAPVLIDRLVRKFANAEIASAEGPAEVITDEILRFVDGTKPTFDAALRAASEVFARHQVEMPASPLSMDSLMKVIEDMTALHDDLVREIKAILDAYRGESVFKNLVMSQISQELMYGSHGSAYGPLFQQFNTLLYNSDVVFEINGKTVQVSRVDLDIFTNGLPYDSQNLYRYPGVKASVDSSFLSSLVGQDLMNRISYLDFNATENLTPSAGEVQYFSNVARRFQLLEVFLKTWPDVLTDGKVNFDKLRFHLLISYELEMELGRAEEYIKQQISLMNTYSKDVLSESDYLAMKDLLRSSNEELVKRFMPLLQNVIYDTSNEVTSRVQLRFNELVNSFSAVLGRVSAMVVIVGGQEIKVDLKKIKESVLDVILNATSIAQSGQFDNSAYLRMNGIDAAMMSSLMTREEMGSLRQIRFYNYASSWRSGFAAGEEILFNLIPQLVKKMGTANEADLAKKLTENMDLPVSLGENLRFVINQRVVSLSQTVLDRMRAVSLNSINNLLALRDLLVNYHSDLDQAMADLTKNLTAAEKLLLQSDFNSYWGMIVPNFGTVANHFRNMIASVDALDVAGVRISLRTITSIAGFPSSKDFDHELFSGLEDEDFTGAETYDEYSKHAYFYLQPQPSFQTSNHLSVLGRIQMIAHAAERILGNSDLPSNMVIEDSAGIKTLNTEAFRKYIKGVLRMQQETIAEAEKRALAMAEELRGMEKSAYTIEEIEAIHQRVLKFREDLINLLNQKASKHERGDVIQIENQISLIHQKNVFDLFVSMVGKAKLVLAVQGQLVEISAKVITENLLAVLTEKLDGKNPAAHDFAMFYGISVDVLRRIHKLENYMGEQMVIMPRNSEYVQIVSQISELGYMELAAYLVGRYADEVVRDGRVDVTRLLELVNDKERAIQKVTAAAADILDQKIKELESFNHPLSLEDLRRIGVLSNDARIAWISMMNDFLSGLNDPDAKVRLETFINVLNEKLNVIRDGLLADNPVEIELGDRKALVYLTGEMIARFRTETERSAAEALQQETFNDFISAKDMPHYYGEDGLVLSLPQVMASESTVSSPYHSTGIISQRSVLIWNPLPRYNADHHITDFGLETLMARLISKFGEFVLVPDAAGSLALDMDLFIKELYLSDENRSDRRIQNILDYDIPASEQAIAGMRAADGSFKIENINQLNELFLKIKGKILKALPQGYSQKAAQAGQKLVVLYNGAILGPLSLEIGGRRISYDAKALSAVIDRLKQNKEFDSEFLKQFSDLLKNGETAWQFSDFLTIPQNYYSPYSKPVYLETSFIESEDPAEVFDGITLGQLDRFVGIGASDLTGLDVKEKNKLRLSPIEPLQLMGLLDMRTLGPGSGVSAGGLMNTSTELRISAQVLSVGMSKVVVAPDYYLSLPVDEITNLYRLMFYKSSRFIVLELIPAFIKKLGVDKVTSADGKIIPELFERGLKGELTYPAEIDLNGKRVQVALPELQEQIRNAALEARLASGQICDEGCALAEDLYLLKGVRELFSLDELIAFESEREEYAFSPSLYTHKGWIDFMFELLSRMDAKGQEILAPINYLVDPGPDAPMFGVINEKVIELVKSGLEDPSAEKWEEIKAAMEEISGQIVEIKRLLSEYEPLGKQFAKLNGEYGGLKEILEGKKNQFVYWMSRALMNYEVLLPELEDYLSYLQEAFQSGNLEKAETILKEYRAMTGNVSDHIPSFEATVEQLLKMTSSAKTGIVELPGLIKELKIQIAERSKMWEEQAMAALKGYQIVSSVEMLPSGEGYWSYEGELWPSSVHYYLPVIYLGAKWVEPRFFDVTLQDGTRLKMESRNGIIDPDMIVKYLIYPATIEINGKNVNVDMRALTEKMKGVWEEAVRGYHEENGAYPEKMDGLLLLKGVEALFSADEISGFISQPSERCFYDICYAPNQINMQFSDYDWVRFAAELLSRMDLKEQKIFAAINYFVDPGPDAPMFSVINEKVLELVKNGLEDPNAEKWDTVKNALSEIDSQLEQLNALKNELNVPLQARNDLRGKYAELEFISAGHNYWGPTYEFEYLFWGFYTTLIRELEGYQESLRATLEAGSLEKALNDVSAYEAMKNNADDLIPSFEVAAAEIQTQMTEAERQIAQLSERIQALEERIAVRSKEWEDKAMAALKSFQAVSSVEMLPPGESHLSNGAVSWPSNLMSYHLPVGYAGLIWVEPRFFNVTLKSGTQLKIESRNGIIDPDMIVKYLIYPVAVEIDGKNVNVDMRALTGMMKAVWEEAVRGHYEKNGTYPEKMDGLLLLEGVKELFSSDEISGFISQPSGYCIGDMCYLGSTQINMQFSDADWVGFTKELLQRMYFKRQDILESLVASVQRFGSDETGVISAEIIWSVKIDKVIELVKNGLEDPNAKKWEEVRAALDAMTTQLGELKLLQSDLNEANRKKISLEESLQNFDRIWLGVRNVWRVFQKIFQKIDTVALPLIELMKRYQAILEKAIESKNLENALSALEAYNAEAEKLPSYEESVVLWQRLISEAQARSHELKGAIQVVKNKIAARSNEWEKQALQAVRQYGDMISNVALDSAKEDFWRQNPASYCDERICVDYAPGEHWVERRYFTIQFSDGSLGRGVSENGKLDSETVKALEEKKKQLNQPKPSDPPLAKPLPPPPAPVYRAPLARLAPLAKAFSGIFRGAARIFKKASTTN